MVDVNLEKKVSICVVKTKDIHTILCYFGVHMVWS